MAPPRASAGSGSQDTPREEVPSPDPDPATGVTEAGAPPDAAVPPSDARPPQPVVLVTQESLVVAGVARAFVLAAPREGARALVLALHGDGGDGGSFRADLPLDVATAAGAVVAYPSGAGRSWDLYTPTPDNADQAFLTALVASLRARFAIDGARVFATGFSSGAFMVNQVACRQPTLFRAIAAHGGGAPDEPEDPAATTWAGGYTRCAGQTSGVPALVVHGEQDGVVSWDSGSYTARYWAAVDGCGTGQVAASGSFGLAGCVQAAACPATTPVVFCSVPGLGHTLWGSAGALTWAFFAGM